MATTVLILGESGSGKSTTFRTLDPKETYYINCDGKSLPFRYKSNYNKDNKNYVETSDLEVINRLIPKINLKEEVKVLVIDTINGIMLDKEMSSNFRGKTAGGEARNKWMDLAAEVYDLILSLNKLRDDLIVFVTGHVFLYTDIDGLEKKSLITNGRKLEKIKLESKFPIVLCTRVTCGNEGVNQYELETQSNMSTAKSPMEMFDTFIIPNDGKLIIERIKEYYNG